MPRLDVCLQWAVSGCVVKKWHGVPAQTTLGELVTDELDNLPGEMRIIHKSKEVMLQDELQMFTASVDTVLTFNLLRRSIGTGCCLCSDPCSGVSLHCG